jgi:hypothetical protein
MAGILDDVLLVGSAVGPVAVQHRPVWSTIGWGGHSSGPGQPGTKPMAPRAAISQKALLDTIMSSAPRIQRIGGLGSMATMPLASKYLRPKALTMPRVPGQTPGQWGEGLYRPDTSPRRRVRRAWS